VPSFGLEELLATKLRALYQRRKGRDLFDLWVALTTLSVDDQSVIDGLTHYMRDEIYSYPQLSGNLNSKLVDRTFLDDLAQLLSTLPAGYDPRRATDLILQRFGRGLRNAPTQP
jgi:predicted nucleotidyltransferase component of viral defense system